MDGFKLFHRLHLKNILSYGPKAEPIDLEPLNVLIGPNGSGKSNLIEAISLLKAAPSDLAAPIRAGGGAVEWLWKGELPSDSPLSIAVTLSLFPRSELQLLGADIREEPLSYTLAMVTAGAHFMLVEELIEQPPECDPGQSLYRCTFRDRGHRGGKAIIKSRVPVDGAKGRLYERRVQEHPGIGEVAFHESILSQIKDIVNYPEITLLGRDFAHIGLFRSIGIGRDSKARGPQRADEPASFLLEDGRNLGIVLNDLLNQPPTKKRILTELQRFYGRVEDITTKIYANTVETYFHEPGFSQSTPSIRLSDGTLRYLALLTILCHPEPPPLVCIEDPEVGLHPDILPHLADLLVEASQRMQLIVTTHSDIMVSALSHVPEAVVVCERDDEGTHLRRLDAASLHQWLKKYTLGELWSMGELGGNP